MTCPARRATRCSSSCSSTSSARSGRCAFTGASTRSLSGTTAASSIGRSGTTGRTSGSATACRSRARSRRFPLSRERRKASSLIDLDPGLLDNPAPARRLALEDAGEAFRRAAGGLQTVVRQLLLHFGAVNRFVHLAVQPLDDLL